MPARLNPADPQYQVRRLLADLGGLRRDRRQATAAGHVAGSTPEYDEDPSLPPVYGGGGSGTGPGGGGDGSPSGAYSVVVGPDGDLVFTFTDDDGSDEIVLPDGPPMGTHPDDPDRIYFPEL